MISAIALLIPNFGTILCAIIFTAGRFTPGIKTDGTDWSENWHKLWSFYFVPWPTNVQLINKLSHSYLQQQNDFSPFYCKNDNCKVLKIFYNIESSKPMWNILILNCILLIKRYNLCKVLACLTSFFQLSLFCSTFFQFLMFILFISSKTSSPQRVLGLPIGLLDMSFLLLIFCTFIILNFIFNSCIWNTGVTWQDTDYKLPEEDTIVSKHVGVW